VKLTVIVESHGAHAEEDPADLAASVLRDAADKITDGACTSSGHLWDVNGNRVGTWSFEV
jgi:hypothetical protein